MTRVILVEDEPEVATVLCNLIEHCGGCVVGLFYNGRQAADSLLPLGEEWPAVVDMVISDNNMPLLKGIDLFFALRDKGISIPFTLLSGLGLDQVEEARARSRGGVVFVFKPVGMKTMDRVINGRVPGKSS